MLYNDNWVSAHNGGSEQPYLYDDGTHGDNIAGDGLYTNNCMYQTIWAETNTHRAIFLETTCVFSF